MRAPERIGRYRVQSLIGVGGFAVVYRAHDEALDDTVAIKILAENWVSDAETRDRFLEEARLLRRIRDDHLVTVHDVGELDGGQPYFVMEFAKRGSLADRLAARAGTGLDPASARRIVTGLARGLGALHRAGIVHRDVNPRNLFLQGHDAAGADQPRGARATHVRRGLVGADERILLGDLGLAKDVVRTGGAASVIGGTPHYHAPEQLDPRAPVQPAADVFAATGVLWEAITGTPPPSPSALAQSLGAVDERWHPFFERGLSGHPDERFEHMDAWREAFLASLDSNAEALTGAPWRAPPELATVGPYKGLAPFQPEDAGRFFGRDALVGELLERLDQERTLMVGGPSGSGKSSLVRAGLIPAVGAGGLPGSERWPVILFTPRADPIGELAYQLAKSARSVTQQPGSGAADDTFRDPLQARYVAETITDLTGGLLVVIDQFEELFTQVGSRSEQEAFLELLAGVVDPADSRVRVVMAMRADFYGASALFGWLARRITQNQVLVGPMSRAELRQSIEEPARQAGLRLEDGLVDAVLDEGGSEPGALPLVSHALSETWRRRKGTTLTVAGYQEAGGVAGALAQTADEVYLDRFDDAERHAARRLLLRMITPGEGASDTRRSLRLDELGHDSEPEIVTAVAEELTRARLLTVDRETIEIAHETLIHSWPRLRGWIEESRDDLRVRQRIDRAGAEWVAQGREPDLLYRGTPLQSALEWAADHGDALSPAGRELLGASEAAWTAEAERRAQAAQRSRRIRRGAVAVLGVLAVVAGGASVVAFLALDQATARLAQSLATQAVGLAEEDPRLAMALAVESMARGGSPSIEARVALVEANRALEAVPLAPAGTGTNVGDALSVAVRGDGDVVATGGRDGTVRLWEAGTGEALGPPLEGHGGAIQELHFSPDGRWLVTGGDDATVRRWDVQDPAAVPASETLGETGGIVWSVAVSPDGTTVASGSGDGTVRLWDLENLRALGEPVAEENRTFDKVAFAPDGAMLLAGNSRGEVWGWRLPGREQALGPLDAHGTPVWSIAVHPDGALFATSGSDGRVRLWETATGELVAEPFPDAAGGLRGARFTPDGNLLLAGDAQGQVRVWDTASGAVGSTDGGHGSQILDTSLSAGGGVLATLAMDHTLRLWSPADGMAGVVLPGHEDGAFGLAVSPDGLLVATGDGAGAVRVYDIDTGEPVLDGLPGHSAAVWALDFSPDGSRLASGDADGVVLLHDVRTGELVARLEHPGVAVPVVRFHGDRLLTGAADGVVRIWDERGRAVGEPLGAHRGGVTDMERGANRTLAVADREGNIRLWRPDDRAAVSATLPEEGNTVWSIAWSEDRTVLATASADEMVTLWDMAAGRAQASLTPHPGGATGVDFLADGATIVSSSRDGGVRLWDAGLGRAVGGPLSGHEAAVWRVVAHPHDARFVTSSEDGTVRVWDVLDVERACEQAAGAFGAEERRRYLGEGEAAAGCR